MSICRQRVVCFSMIAASALWLGLGACTTGEIDRRGGDSDSDTDTDTDTDVDTDTDADTDTDTDSDTDTDTDSDTGDDPSCGGLNQACCTSGDSCDDPTDLVCVDDPEKPDPWCYATCSPIPCTTLEGYTGAECALGSSIGVCVGVNDGYLPAQTDCDVYGCTSGNCYTYDTLGSTGCFAEGCNYISDCTGSTWCATLSSGDTGACLDL